MNMLSEAVLATSNSGQAMNTSVTSNEINHNSSTLTILPTVIRLSRTDQALLKFVNSLHPYMS